MLEENGPRLLAARVQVLDDAIAAWHGGVGIWVQDQNPLEQIKELLVADGPGKAEVKLNMMVKDHAVIHSAARKLQAERRFPAEFAACSGCS